MRALFLISQNEPPTLQKPHKWTKLFNDFLTNALRKDQFARPGADAMLRHPFVEGAADRLDMDGGEALGASSTSQVTSKNNNCVIFIFIF